MRRPLLAGLVLSSIFAVLPGCFLVAVAAVGAAGYGAISYENNEGWMDYKVELGEAWAASLRALQKLGYRVTGNPRPGATEGTIEADQAKVVVEQHAGGYVRVRVRVGTFTTDDNERRAKLILEEITAQLPRPK